MTLLTHLVTQLVIHLMMGIDCVFLLKQLYLRSGVEGLNSMQLRCVDDLFRN
jgi:hypothetical protein